MGARAFPLRLARDVWSSVNLEGGTAAMRVREKRPKRSASRPAHAFSRPRGGAHRPKPRASGRTASKSTAERDCLLEGTGFEPAVPPDRCRRHINPTHSNREGSSAKTNGKN